MRTARRFASLFLLCAAACTGGGDGDGDRRDPRFDELAQQIEAERLSLGAPAVSVALLEDGEVVWAEGFGSRIADGDKDANANTIYRIGSVNKMLTSAALLRKVDAGLADLDDPVTQHAPAFHFDEDPSWADTITLRQLLTHSSGMFDYLAIDGPVADAQLEAFLTGTSPSSFGSFMWLMSPAGEFWNYSNPNFYVAALVDEKTSSGQFYRDLLHDGVLDPLEMDRTFFLAEEVLDAGNYATAESYDWEDGTSATVIVGPESYDNAWARPAGYAWSTVLDLSKFAQFLLDGNTAVLSDALRAEMQSPVVSTRYFYDYGNYGYGLSVDTEFQVGNSWHETKLVSHDGAIPGYSARMTIVPESRFAFITLASTDGAYFQQATDEALTSFASLPAAVAIPDVGVDPIDFPRFTATYEDPYNIGTMIVTTNGNGLRISMPDLDALSIPYEPDLQPYTETNFVLEVQGYPLLATFFLDTAGNPQYLRTRIGVGIAQGAAFAPAPPPIAGGDALRRAITAPDEMLPRNLRR